MKTTSFEEKRWNKHSHKRLLELNAREPRCMVSVDGMRWAINRWVRIDDEYSGTWSPEERWTLRERLVARVVTVASDATVGQAYAFVQSEV